MFLSANIQKCIFDVKRVRVPFGKSKLGLLILRFLLAAKMGKSKIKNPFFRRKENTPSINASCTKVPCFHLWCLRWGRRFHAGGHAHTSFIYERRCQSKGSSFINQLSVVQVPTRLVCLKVCAFLLTLLMMHCRTM